MKLNVSDYFKSIESEIKYIVASSPDFPERIFFDLETVIIEANTQYLDCYNKNGIHLRSLKKIDDFFTDEF